METTTLVIGGDLFPRDEQELFAAGKCEKLFSKELLDLFSQADYSICNLEGALTNAEEKTPKCGPSLKAPPETIRGIRGLSLRCLALANNHVTDYGTQGYADTVSALEENGIGYFGGGLNSNSIQTHISVSLNGKTFVIYAVSETVFNLPDESTAGVNLYDEYRVCNELKELKSRCDYLIVLYHGGAEYFRYPTPWIRQRFHRMADNGADIVIAQHTHCIGTEERYKGAYLLYGQGNFRFVQKDHPDLTNRGLLLEIAVSKDGYEVRRHLVTTVDGMTMLDPGQDLSDFEERNERLARGETFEKEYSAYSEEWMTKWLVEFRGFKYLELLLRRLLPQKKFTAFLRRKYKDVTVLRMLEHVRGEEDVEVMIQGLKDFY
ncbi:MAG: CapA family protein [Oscillospiraceae bacterium]|nr:CapA family protein [Oscillospiraceae bacterium]